MTMMQKLQAKRSKKGFTLVELVIVIAILAILAAIAIPTIISTIDSANKSSLESNGATIEMQVKAAVNEAKAKTGTDYNGTAAEGVIGVNDVAIADILKTNNTPAGADDLAKGSYKMYIDLSNGDILIGEGTTVPTQADGTTDATEFATTIKIKADGSISV